MGMIFGVLLILLLGSNLAWMGAYIREHEKKMIKAETGDANRVEIRGTLREIMTDTCVVVNRVYRSVKGQSEEHAEILKDFIKEMAASGELFRDFGDEESKDD